jgi:hypothetical protein
MTDTTELVQDGSLLLALLWQESTELMDANRDKTL